MFRTSWKRRIHLAENVVFLLCMLSFHVGCDELPSKTNSSSSVSSASGSSPPPPPVSSGDSNLDNFSFAPTAPSSGGAKATGGPLTRPTPSAPTSPSAGNELVIAEPGVGKRGRGYGGGMVSEPAKQYFKIRERIVFQIQIPDAIKKFRALNPTGDPPASHAEFMNEIVGKFNITLPDLPASEEYWYDAEKGELMVLRSE